MWKNCGNVSQLKRFAECAVSSPWPRKVREAVSKSPLPSSHERSGRRHICRKTVFFTKKRTKKTRRPQKTTERPEKHRNTEKKKGEKRNV